MRLFLFSLIILLSLAEGWAWAEMVEPAHSANSSNFGGNGPGESVQAP